MRLTASSERKHRIAHAATLQGFYNLRHRREALDSRKINDRTRLGIEQRGGKCRMKTSALNFECIRVINDRGHTAANKDSISPIRQH